MTPFYVRVKELQGTLNDAAFARKTGVPVATMKRYASGSSPSVEVAMKIADSFGVSLDWLCGRDFDDPSDSHSVQLRSLQLDDSLLAIPVYNDVRPSAGDGGVAIETSQSGVIAFQESWFSERGIDYRAAKVLWAQGDSMYPTIPNGSPMIVDTSKREIANGCIYVFDVDGDLLVKRIEKTVDGEVHLISDNKELYPVRSVSRDRLSQLVVIGRVFSAMRNF